MAMNIIFGKLAAEAPYYRAGVGRQLDNLFLSWILVHPSMKQLALFSTAMELIMFSPYTDHNAWCMSAGLTF